MPPERTTQTYSSAITAASKSALLELMTMLRSYRKALVLVGGWVPYQLLKTHQRPDDPFEHIGSIDIDLAVDPKHITATEYATIVDLLTERGYQPTKDRAGKVIPFCFDKAAKSPLDGKVYKIRVDFLTHDLDDRPGKHRHLPIQDGLLARKAKGCNAAFQHKTTINLQGTLPAGGDISVDIQMADVVGCLTMKGIVLGERFREKDAYDIYALAAHYKKGPADVAAELRPYREEPLLKEALQNIKASFEARTSHGPVWVAEFLLPASTEERERLITDAHMVVNEVLRLEK